MTYSEDSIRLVLEALDALFNRRDFALAEKCWSSGYIQHSRLVPPGRDGLFDLVRSIPEGKIYEAGLALADGEFVMVHGRYNLPGQRALVAVDIFRVRDEILIEHWDVLQEEATMEESAGGHPMFAGDFAQG